MRKIIALFWLMLLCGTSWGATYPEIGVCTGDNVRLRERPGTNGRIIGRADTGTQFVLLGEVHSGGQKWYMIDHPEKKGNAYIVSDYVNYGWYHGSNGVIPTGRDFVEVRQIFGMTREKARALFGRPKSTDFEGLQYPGIELMYDEGGNLSYARTTRKEIIIAGVQAGDNIIKLVEMGMPEQYITDLEEIAKSEEPESGPEGWTYESTSGETIFFGFGGNDSGFVVEDITWSRPEGEG